MEASNPESKTDSLHLPHSSTKSRVDSVAEYNASQSNSTVTFQAEMYIGPIAAPHILAQYKKIDPKLVDRLVTMAERQGEHRRMLESAVVHSQNAEAKRGTYCGFVIALAGLGVCMFFGYLGHSVAATILGCIDLTALVGLFVRSWKEDGRVRK